MNSFTIFQWVRQRISINGVLDSDNLEVATQVDVAINAQFPDSHFPQC